MFDKLFKENTLKEVIDWGGLVCNLEGEYYIDKNIAPDVLCFDLWYKMFPKNSIWIPQSVVAKALYNLNSYMLLVLEEDIKSILIKEIIFEYAKLKFSGEVDSYLNYLN